MGNKFTYFFMDKRTKIVHLDDHRLFLNGLSTCINHKFSHVELISFGDTNEAFYYVINSILKNKKIDLLITDINHPGLNGYEFAKAIRNIERWHGSQLIPILILTMVPKGVSMIDQGFKDGLFDDHLTKDVDAEIIANSILKFI